MTAEPALATLTPEAPRVAAGFDPRAARLAIVVLAVLVAASVVLFMTYDLRGSLSYALELRARKVGALCVVGFCLAHSTVMFHTITHNRILTPSLIGFDALYVLIQTSAAYVLGTFAFLQIDERIRFLFEVAVMLLFASVLHRRLFRRAGDDIYLLVLVGIVMGTMFTGLTALVTRMIDPNEYLTLQDLLFPSFAAVDRDLLIAATGAVAVVVVASLPMVARLDVVALGRTTAVCLGVDHDRLLSRTLAVVAILVSVATALVGPVVFLGLIVANLAYRVTGTFRHRYTLPAAGLIAMLAMVGGQFVLEELLESETRLSIIVGFVGGMLFLALLLREASRG